MERIIIEPFEIWSYYEEHEERLANYKHLVAENDDFGIKVWITVEDFGLALVVEEDGTEIHREYIMDESDAEEVTDLIYEEYVMPGSIKKLIIDSDKKKVEEEDILFRESDLEVAVIDFMSTVCDQDFSKQQDVIEDVKEHFLEYLARKWDASIYRPMYLQDVDTDEKYFAEYPYKDLVFEDEGNPIYKK